MWLYATLRGFGFAVALGAGYGAILLDAVLVSVLIVALIRRRRWAWIALIVVDVLSLAQVVAATRLQGPLLVVAAQLGALLVLFLPSIRRHVAT